MSPRRRSVLAGMLLLAASACARDGTPAPARDTIDRVVSQAIVADEVLWALGPAVRDRVVGVSQLADDERYSSVAGLWPDDKVRVASSTEAVLALAPDLVIAASFTTPEVRTLLTKAGVRVMTLEGFAGFDDYRRHVGEIAAAVGAPQAGAGIVAAFDARLAALRVDVPARKRPTIVSYTDGNAAGSGTTFDDQATAAGFVNLAAREGVEGHGRLGLETLLHWNPRFVAIPCGAAPCDVAEDEFAGRGGLSALDAVKSGNVIAIPAPTLYATGAAMLDVVEDLAARRTPGKDDR